MTTRTNLPNGSRHRLLALSRRWHKWGGVLAAGFLLLTGASGIVLNYKKPIFTALGLERAPDQKTEKHSPAPQAAQLTTANGLAGATVSFEAALARARDYWGDVPLERVELKVERGAWFYKLKQPGGAELWINAFSGAQFTRGKYERIIAIGESEPPMRRTDWGKILLDLHTGKIGGAPGQALMTLVAAVLLLLSVSGLYMWLKPLCIRRKSAALDAPTGRRAAAPSGPGAGVGGLARFSGCMSDLAAAKTGGSVEKPIRTPCPVELPS